MDSYVLEKTPVIESPRDMLLSTIHLSLSKIKQISAALPVSNYGENDMHIISKPHHEKEVHSVSLSRISHPSEQESKIIDSSIILKGRYLAVGGKVNHSGSRDKSRDIKINQFDKQFSYRNYANEANAYSGIEVNHSINSLIRDKSNRRAESSLLKLK